MTFDWETYFHGWMVAAVAIAFTWPVTGVVVYACYDWIDDFLNKLHGPDYPAK